MKKLILTTILMLSSLTYGQMGVDVDTYAAFVIGADIKNATFGSQPTNYKPAFDGVYQLVMVGKDFELNVGYERFNYTFKENGLTVKAFEKYSLGVGYHFPLYGYIAGKEIKTTFIPSLEPSIIWRPLIDVDGMKARPGFPTLGVNFSFQWNISDDFAFQLTSNFLPRPDLNYLYGQNKIVISNYGKLVYKFSK